MGVRRRRHGGGLCSPGSPVVRDFVPVHVELYVGRPKNSCASRPPGVCSDGVRKRPKPKLAAYN
jgi:hypothetical protein